MPAGHALHVALADDPTAVEDVPDTHSVHTAAPVNVLYLPASHAVHVLPPGPVDPALQMQLVEAELAADDQAFNGQALHVALADAPTVTEYVPAAHEVHTAAPVNVLYLPAAHDVHVVPSGPLDPASQVQLVTAELPAGELEFEGQALHAAIADAPTSVEYVLAEQSVHCALPAALLYFPYPHAMQVSPFCPLKPGSHSQALLDVLAVYEREFVGHVEHA